MPVLPAAQDQPVLGPVKVVPPWTGPALRRNMAAIGKQGQARSAKSKCPRFQGTSNRKRDSGFHSPNASVEVREFLSMPGMS